MEKIKEGGHSLGFQFRLIHIAYETRVNRILSDYDLTYAQTLVFQYMAEHPEEIVTPKVLEEQFHLKHPTVVGILQKGLILGVVNPRDRRSKILSLTEQGKQTEQMWRQRLISFRSYMGSLLAEGFSEEEKRLLQGFLDRVIENLRTEEKDEREKNREYKEF